MAFWGVEVKPGKPFIHASSNGRRLHISQATLGTGSSLKSTVVQCNVGHASPVFLCSLFPEKAESSQLHLEFEETVEVMFSVIGPRSVHLTGYYLSGHHFRPDDESESYGEDIADTETERSTNESDEDEYEDSFINDDDPEVIPPSPVSSGRVEEMVDKKKIKSGRGSNKRLRKKFQLIDSDDEDRMPISLLHDRESGAKGTGAETEKEKNETSKEEVKETDNWVIVPKWKADAVVDGESKSLYTQNRQTGHHLPVPPSSELGSQNGAKPKKKKYKRCEKEKPLEAGLEDDFFFGMAVDQQKSRQGEVETDELGQYLPVTTEEDQKTANDEKIEEPKKRRIKIAKEKKVLEAASNLSCVHEAQKDDTEAKNTVDDMLQTDEENQKHTNHELVQIEDEVHNEAEVKNTGHDMLLANKENQSQANDNRAVLLLNSNPPPSQLDPPCVTKPKRKRKELADKKILEVDSDKVSTAIKEHIGEADDFKSDSWDHELSVQDDRENGAKRKGKKRKLADKQTLETDSVSHCNAIKEEEGKKYEYKSVSLNHVSSVQEEQNQKQQSYATYDFDQSADASRSEKKLKKKKKKKKEENKSRSQESGEAFNGCSGRD